MLRFTLQVLHQNYSHVIPRASLSTIAMEKWDLFTSVCVERRPKIVPQMNDIEKQMHKQLRDVELENSLKSEFELRHEADIKQAEILKKGDIDISLKQTAQDFADASLEELNTFQVECPVTDADTTQNVKALNRKLDKHLILLTEQKIGDKTFFIPPQGMRQDGETLRQTAERVLKESVGEDMKTQIYSNAPAGFYKYKYPKDVRNESKTVGAKVFIYFARYNKGDISQKGLNYKWLDREELKHEIPEKYHDSLKLFLMDE